MLQLCRFLVVVRYATPPSSRPSRDRVREGIRLKNIVLNALCADPSRGGLCVKPYQTRIEEVRMDAGALHPLGEVQIDVTCGVYVTQTGR